MPMITPDEYEKYNVPKMKPCKECGELPILRDPDYWELTVWDFRRGTCDWVASCPKCKKRTGFYWSKESAINEWNENN